MCPPPLPPAPATHTHAKSLPRPLQPIFDQTPELWASCNVIAHFELDHDVDATLAIAQDILGLPEPLAARQMLVPSAEWVDQMKAAYVPLKVGGCALDRFWIGWDSTR